MPNGTAPVMDDAFGIAAALAVILSGLAFFVVVGFRRKNAIEKDGFLQTETADEALVSLARSLFDAAPTETHEKEDLSGQSWLAFLDAGSSEGSGCAMLVYPMRGWDGLSLVLIRSGRRIPRILRRLEGGLFNWSVPLEDSETRDLEGTGWFAYKAPNQEVPSSFKERMFSAVRVPRSKGLLGIAVIDRYLAVWTDSGRIKTLLETAPLVRSAISKRSFFSWLILIPRR